MGSQAQARAFFALWWFNFAWLLSTLWAFLTLLLFYPFVGVGRAFLNAGSQAVSTSVSAFNGFMQGYLLLGDAVAAVVWIALRFAFPLCWSILFFVVGIDIPTIVANIVNYFWKFLGFIAIFGTIVAVFTWYDNQNQTQQVIDTIYCQIIPFQDPFCKLYNTFADFYETFIPAVNLLLDVIYDFLEMVFEGLVRLVFKTFSLFIRFLADARTILHVARNAAREQRVCHSRTVVLRSRLV